MLTTKTRRPRQRNIPQPKAIFGAASIASCALIVLGAAGCSSTKSDAYVPNENAAKQALETALSAWQSGKPLARIEVAGGSAIQPQDSEWQKGKKLASSIIGDEVPTTEGPKQFAVQLKFQGEAKPVNAIYYVVGRDPLWVFRDRDYKSASGM